MTTFDERLEVAFDAADWPAARKLLRRELESDPDDHWLLTRLATVEYESRRYDRALELSSRALAIAPRCPLALWDHACALDMLNRTEEAVGLWNRLLAIPSASLASDECGEGPRWAESLRNDVRYRLALSELDRGRTVEAVHALREHLQHRRAGLPSLYTRVDAERRLRNLMRSPVEPGAAACVAG